MIDTAFVLGAGLGTRLRPLTENYPKPLIPIFNKPLITFAFDHLISLGVRSFVVNTHHAAECFRQTFPDGHYRSHTIQFIHEPKLLGTAGGIKNAEPLLGEKPFLVYSGDLLTDLDIATLVESHFANGHDVTLALRKTDLAAPITLDGTRIIDIRNHFGHSSHFENFDYANISVWNPSVFKRLPAGKELSIAPILTEWLHDKGNIGGVVLHENEWFNIGSRKEYLETHQKIHHSNWRPAFPVDPQIPWPQKIHPGAEIDPSAQIDGFSAIGNGVKIHANTRIRDSILWPHSEIVSDSFLDRCIVHSTQKTTPGHLENLDI
ncbi:MAG: sugar phosphate nucleotidyltransferase [Chthoniobacterales bacterium]